MVVGCALLHVLSGSPPFYGKSVEDVYAAILSKEATFTDKKFKHVSAACMDFMRRLLVRDPHGRMSAMEALQHPFITGSSGGAMVIPSRGIGRAGSIDAMEMDPPAGGIADPNKSSVLHTGLLRQLFESMVLYHRADPLCRLIMNMAAHTLGSLELQKFREEFSALDCSGTGGLCRRDFLMAFSSVADSETLKTLFDTLAVSRRHGHANDLTYHEYIAAAMHGRVIIHEARLSLIISYLDPEHKGVITVHSVRSALGDEVPLAEIEAIVRAADFDGDGAVSKGDILELWERVWNDEPATARRK